MKKILLSTIGIGLLFAQTNADLTQKVNKLEKQVSELQQLTLTNQSKVNPVSANSHLFWGLDIRTSYDVISKKTTGGMAYTVNPTMQTNPQFMMTVPIVGGHPATVDAKTYTGQVFSNRVILTGMYEASDNLKGTVKIEANKMFGANYISPMNSPFADFDWVTNETPTNDTVRLKEAYFNYHFGPENALMFSAGRRPSTEGFPANLREDDAAESPLGHIINMEFDGFSFEIGNPIWAKLSDKFLDWGTWFKFCLGRGASSENGKWTLNGQDYTKQANVDQPDLGGFFFVPYDDGQYSLKTETAWAFHMVGFKPSGAPVMDLNSSYDGTMSQGFNMATVGNFFLENVVLSANGIGDGISDFLDNTTAFASFAYTETRPKGSMLGSTEKKSGHSIWVGADMPSFGDDRFGLSFVKGSKYFRSYSYGEDTLAGSMTAVRGHAYDAYYTHHIIPHLTAQVRYTYIKYDNPGSDSFFGAMGNPDTVQNGTPVNYVKTAKDLRLYVRYRF